MTSLSVRIMWLGYMFSGMRDKAKKSDIRCWARTNRHIIKNKKKQKQKQRKQDELWANAHLWYPPHICSMCIKTN